MEEAAFAPLEIFPNPHESSKTIQVVDPEFSSVCPASGLPDYATVILRYVPNKSCVELKSWKMYLRSFYGVGAFHEHVNSSIIRDFASSVKPHWCQVIIRWGARGGLHTTTGMAWTEESGFTECDCTEYVFTEDTNWDNR